MRFTFGDALSLRDMHAVQLGRVPLSALSGLAVDTARDLQQALKVFLQCLIANTRVTLAQLNASLPGTPYQSHACLVQQPGIGGERNGFGLLRLKFGSRVAP